MAAEQTMSVGLFGATGVVGKQVLKRCLEKGYQVKALARKPEKLQDYDSQITIVKGGISDKDAVKEVCSGVDVVISSLGNVGKFQIMAEAARNILEAEPNRIIVLSSLGVEKTSCCTWCLLRYCFAGEHFNDYEAADKIWRESDQDITLVRGCNLEGSADTSAYGTLDEGFSWGAISKEVMGDWLVEQVEDSLFEKKKVQVYQEGSGPTMCCMCCFCCTC